MNIENGKIEFKRELADSIEKDVVSFLNTHGGEIYIGIANDGTVFGVDDPDAVQLALSDRIKNNIRPETLGLFDIHTEEREEKIVVRLFISSGPDKPYYIAKYGRSSKGCFIRIGSSAVPMTDKMIDEMYSSRIHTSISIMASSRQNLTFNQLKAHYAAKGITLNDRFADSLGLLTTDGRYNVLAYLLADENDVSMKVAKYAGTDKCDLLESTEYGYCCLITATNRILERMTAENVTMTKITYPRRIERKLVEPEPLREALINMVVHNDFTKGYPPVAEIFSDRIELTSYGGLVPGQNEEDFFSGASMPRNRELMRIFKDLDLVEQLGSGMNRILRSYDRSIFRISEHFIRVSFPFAESPNENDTLRRKNDTLNALGDTLNDTLSEVDDTLKSDSTTMEERIITILSESPNMTYEELAKSLSVGRATIARMMKKMIDNGLIERSGSKKTGEWRVLK